MCRPRLIVACVAWVCSVAAEVTQGGYTGVDLYPVFPPPTMGSSVSASAFFGGQVTGSGSGIFGQRDEQHAVLWMPNGQGVDFHPAGFHFSYATDTDATRQLGLASDST